MKNHVTLGPQVKKVPKMSSQACTKAAFGSPIILGHYLFVPTNIFTDIRHDLFVKTTWGLKSSKFRASGP